MSDNNPGGNDSASGASKTSMDDQNLVSHATHSKLLGEKKKIQAALEAKEARIAELEQASLEADGKIKEAYELQKKHTETAKNQFSELFNHVTNKVLKQKVFSEVEKFGGVDPDTVYKIMDFEGVEFTKEFDLVDETVLQKKIQEIAKAKPFLFKKDVKLPNDRTPNNSGATNSSEKPVSEMTREELSKALAKAHAGGN